MDEKGPEIRVEDVENNRGKLQADYNENIPHEFFPNNLSRVHYGRKKKYSEKLVDCRSGISVFSMS